MEVQPDIQQRSGLDQTKRSENSAPLDATGHGGLIQVKTG
jgi:hypothetical protein